MSRFPGLFVTPFSLIDRRDGSPGFLGDRNGRCMMFSTEERIYRYDDNKIADKIALGTAGQIAMARSDNIYVLLSGYQQVLRGHRQMISDLAFSPDNRVLISGSYDQTVRVWTVATGYERKCLRGHTSVASVAFNPNGQVIASGYSDGITRLWALPSGRQLMILPSHGDEISLAFSPDGQLIATNSWNCIRIWDVKSGRQLRIIGPHEHFDRIIFTPNGRYIVSVARGNMYLVDIRTGQEKMIEYDRPNVLFTGSAIYINCPRILLDNRANFELVLIVKWPCSHLYDPRVWRDVARFV